MFDFAAKVQRAEEGNTHLFFLGQAGFILKSSRGNLLGVDLYLSECAERLAGHIGFKRLLPCILDASELTFDAIVATHWHWDHFDQDAIPNLMSASQTRLFASSQCEQTVTELCIPKEQVTYVKPGDCYKQGDFELDFVTCDHGQAAPDAVGLIITVDKKKIYMTGDTCLRLDRIAEYLSKGPIDVLIAPINGASGNLNEHDCAELSAALHPGLTIPCHYGMFVVPGGDPGLFLRNMRTICPLNDCLIMAQGEGIVL